MNKALKTQNTAKKLFIPDPSSRGLNAGFH